MTEVYFGGDGCPTCGRAVEEPWNRPHTDWCAEIQAREPFAFADGYRILMNRLVKVRIRPVRV